MFSKLKSQVLANFNILANEPFLFYVTIDRDEIFQQYLSGFTDPEEKQGHDCNCCKSFLRQYGGIVAIIDNKTVSIWDNLEPEELYAPSVANLQKYIHSLEIGDVFINDVAKCGTDKNKDGNVIWEHFSVVLPAKFIKKKDDLDSLRGKARESREMLERALIEITDDAVETTLELIAQNSLYKGREFEGNVFAFKNLKNQFSAASDEEKSNFLWVTSTTASQATIRIRNSAIGTLLENLSKGMELDVAVAKYEQVTAPSNYKRPTAIVTAGMVEKAKDKLAEMGLTDSLERRFANESDLNIQDIIFIDKTSTIGGDVFSEIAKNTIVNPQTLSKIEEVTIDVFIKAILPVSKSVEVLLERPHLNNLVSIVTAKEKEAKSLFKWNNLFSWSYTGGITDSIKEKVKAAGGVVDGELRVSLSWYNYDDLDLHVIEPGGNRIDFTNRGYIHPSSGRLDVDMNAGGGTTREPVENIVWTHKDRMREGVYKVAVHNYARREREATGFSVQIEQGGQVFDFDFKTSPANQKYEPIVEFTYSKVHGIIFTGQVQRQVVSIEKWGVKTNQFTKVKSIFLSPNHWEKQIGNRHFMFMLDGCVSDEPTRPFFNEYLKDEFTENRKVFEILGSKLKIEPDANQLSGIGFSDTKRDELIVRVEGAFKRTLKVKF